MSRIFKLLQLHQKAHMNYGIATTKSHLELTLTLTLMRR